MALPHLKVERGTRNSNFKNFQEASFVTKSRKQENYIESQERYVEQNARFDNANLSYDKLISDDVYEQSLRTYIALREKARKDELLVQRRERLSYLLRNEHQLYLDEIKLIDTPECKILYDDIRRKGFFEKLYEDDGRSTRQPVVPPHLKSEYEEALFGSSGDPRQAIIAEKSKREDYRNFLLSQQNEKRIQLKKEQEMRIEEESRILQNLRMKDDQERNYQDEQRHSRKQLARENVESARSARRNNAALEMANQMAVEEEALRSQSREIATRALAEARRQELREAAQLQLDEQRREKEKEKRLEYLQYMEERRQYEQLARQLDVEKHEEGIRKQQNVKTVRDTYSAQVQHKRDKRNAELEALREEERQNREAEAAYQALLEKETNRIRADSKFRYKTSRNVF